MKQKFSIYTLFAFSAVLVIGLFDFAFTRQNWLKEYREVFADRVDRLNDESYSVSLVYRGMNDEGLLVEYLESRRRAGAVSAWILTQNGVPQRTSLPMDWVENQKFNLENSSDEVFRLDPSTYYTFESLAENGAGIILMLKYDEAAFLKRQAQLAWSTLVKYLAGVSVLVVLIFAYFFRDIARLIRQFSRGNVASPEVLERSSNKAVSREAALLGKGLWAAKQERAEILRKRDLYGQQILPSFKKEIDSGREPPYDFSCTLVRTDINNFTPIFNSEHREHFTEKIRDFFKEVSIWVENYNGYVHQFVGDEILFYFKDEECENSVAAALGCLREVNRSAERISLSCQSVGYSFTVKSSLSAGEMRFAPFVNGFSIAGPPLIESVRLLNHVSDKSMNQICLPKALVFRAEGVVRAEFKEEVLLKGYSEPTQIYLVTEFQSLNASNLRSFRSDEDLLPFLQQNWRERPEGLYLHSFQLKKMKSALGSGPVLQALFQLAERLMNESSPLAQRCLANILVSIPGFAGTVRENRSQVMPDSELQQRLKPFFAAADSRVVANAIEAWGRLGLSVDCIREFVRSSEPRIRANAILFLADHDLAEGMRELQLMLSDRSAAVRSSALFVHRELELKHKNLDPVRWSSLVKRVG